ncbi:AAA family ATPase [Hazenella sp. IB182357]|uniref:AAA family ATPase n=1 Tax=Polycladospora coralii TaxID=2771432 RepID=A0A926N7G5_9BACL|nr:AAA family ATPase [Polycladospora coralii]MBD1371032.1 AAA family ATPase [Polycladospora coralii]MBS7529972.1 AAA family ATPase [Polycladospora coralii]
MKLNRVKFRGFGRWVDQEFRFEKGINLVEAPNEAGKSTLVQGILALWFGSKKEGSLLRKKADWYDRYLPWESDQYGGEIEYVLNEDRYRLIRNLILKKESEQLINLTYAKDVTNDYQMDRKKDHRFLETKLKLSGESFRQIACLNSITLGQEKNRQLQHHDAMMVEKLKNATNQSGHIDVQATITEITKQINDLGTIKAEGKRIAQLNKSIEEKKASLDFLKEKYTQYHQEKATLIRTQLICHNLETKLKEYRVYEEGLKQEEKLQYEITHLQSILNPFKEKVAQYQKKWAEIQKLKEELEKAKPPHFVQYEEYYELVQNQKRRRELESAIEEMSIRLQENKVSIAEITNQQDGSFPFDWEKAQTVLYQLKEFSKLDVQNQELLDHLELNMKEDAPLTELQKDLNKLDELRREEASYRTKKKVLNHQIAIKIEKDSEPLLDSSNGMKWFYFSVVGFIITLYVMIKIPLAFIFPAILTYYTITKWSRLREGSVLQNEKDLEKFSDLQYDVKNLDDKLCVNFQKQDNLLNKWNVKTVDDLYRKRDLHQDASRVREQGKRVLAHNEAEMNRIRYEVEHWMSPYVNQIPQFEVDKYMLLTQSIIDEQYQKKVEFSRLETERRQIEEDLNHSQMRLQACMHFLNDWKVRYGEDRLEQVKFWLEQQDIQNQLSIRLEEHEKQFQDIERIYTAEKWKERYEDISLQIKEIEQRLAKLKHNRLDISDQPHAGQALKKQLEEEKQRLNQIEGSLSKLSEWVEDISKIETEINVAQRELDALNEERDLLICVKNTLLESVGEVKDQLLPQIVPHANFWIDKITDGRYQEIFLQSGNQIKMDTVVPETGENKSIEHLSRGTIDQMFFAFRLGLVQYYSEQTSTPLPLFLDDCFIHFDELRMRKALILLGELSKEHQIMICTCQSRERKLLEEMRIKFHSIHI